MPANLENSAVATGLEKVSFHLLKASSRTDAEASSSRRLRPGCKWEQEIWKVLESRGLRKATMAAPSLRVPLEQNFGPADTRLMPRGLQG